MKLGIVGKGGVGKTTVCALLAGALTRRGRRVVAIDTDSNPNLGVSLGLTSQQTEAVPVLPSSLVTQTSQHLMSEEQVLTTYGTPTPSGATLISAIKVTEAGAGCMCGGHRAVRSLLGDVLAEQADVTLVDMEAGLEHLSRSGGTLANADVLLVVMEPSRKSVITAARTLALAGDLGILRTYGLGNKARPPADEEFFTQLCADFGVPLLGVIPDDDRVRGADRAGTGVGHDIGAATILAVDAVVRALKLAEAPTP